MAGIRLEGNTSGNVAEVDAVNGLKVNLSKILANAGYAIQMNENDPGAVTGVPYLLSPEVTDDYRQRVGLDTLLISETFNYTLQDSGKWSNILTGAMTVTYVSGFMILNGGGITTTTTGALVKSYKVVPFFGASPTYIEFHAAIVQAPQTNNIIELGVGIPATANGALTDGIVFRWDATGVLKGVVNDNGVETLTGVIPAVTVGNVYKYAIVITTDEAQFWIDDVLQAKVEFVSSGSTCSEASLPIIMRTYNTAGTSLAQQVKISQCTVSLGDWNTNKPWEHQMSAMGGHISSAQGGSTAGSTSNNVNNTAPATSAGTNAAAGYTTLGGQFAVAAIAGVETDFIIFGFQNPVSAVAVTGKQIYITDIAIDTYNTVAAVGATGTVFQWSVGYGSTALTLLTTEAAATKVARRINLGVQYMPAASAIGFTCAQINRNFTTPICLHPSEFLQIILKMPIGLLTATELYRGTVSIVGYWE
jgi:hypothetical protein